MSDYDYLVIGGGMACAAAIKGIRDIDAGGSIGVIAAESDKPYKRPPLTKQLWKGKDLDTIWMPFPAENVEFHSGVTAKSIDRQAHIVNDNHGESHIYGKLLIATGGTPTRLSVGGDNVIYFRNLTDYRRLHDWAQTRSNFVVIGAGFIGSEIAAALTMNGKEVTMVFPEDAIGARVFPGDAANHITDMYRSKGIRIITGGKIIHIHGENGSCELTTESGEILHADGVVAGLGIQPATHLGDLCGLDVRNGIVVDEHLRTSDASIYAAGDVANFYNPALDQRMRVEHEDNALAMGELAGKNMAGEKKKYDYLPYFYSDLFDLGYEAIGRTDSSLETFADWKSPFEEGVIYYLESGRVRGVLLWNVWDKVDQARTLIAEPGPFSQQNLQGRISA